MRTLDQRTIDLGRVNFATLLAVTALVFLFLVVLGLGRPAFATGVTQTQFNAFQS